jgi:sugar/nucleoside kinase (ribokinase family)
VRDKEAKQDVWHSHEPAKRRAIARGSSPQQVALQKEKNMLNFDQTKPIDVTGVGNAILDILAFMPDEFLAEQGMNKGDMALIDEDRAKELYALMGQTQEASGGSVANSVAGIAGLGGKAAFIGRVRDDQFGGVYAHDLRSVGVQFSTPATSDGPATGCSYIMVTPDGERTMNTNLGAGAAISAADMDEALIAKSKVVFCEGYQWSSEENIAALKQAFSLANANGGLRAFTLSAVFCVEMHREAFKALIQDSVDILFTNEAEAQALYPELSIDDILQKLGEQTQLTAMTMSEKGSKIICGGKVYDIAPQAIEKVTDATGAGDLYAGALLYGLTNGMSIEDAGALASKCSAQIIQQLGARAMKPLKTLVA